MPRRGALGTAEFHGHERATVHREPREPDARPWPRAARETPRGQTVEDGGPGWLPGPHSPELEGEAGVFCTLWGGGASRHFHTVARHSLERPPRGATRRESSWKSRSQHSSTARDAAGAGLSSQKGPGRCTPPGHRAPPRPLPQPGHGQLGAGVRTPGCVPAPPSAPGSSRSGHAIRGIDPRQGDGQTCHLGDRPTLGHLSRCKPSFPPSTRHLGARASDRSLVPSCPFPVPRASGRTDPPRRHPLFSPSCPEVQPPHLTGEETKARGGNGTMAHTSLSGPRSQPPMDAPR